MATSGRGTGIVGYNVQTAVDAKHHMIVAHEVTNVGHDRDQLAAWPSSPRRRPAHRKLIALADRGYFEGYEILECERAGIAALVPKPMTSNSRAEGRFDKRDFVYDAQADEYRCPAGQIAIYRFTADRRRQELHKYWTSACPSCPLKPRCTTGNEPTHRALGARGRARDGSSSGWTARPRRCAPTPADRRARVRHAEGLDGSTHFLTKTLPRVRTEMSLQVLAYNLKRAIKILGTASADRCDEGVGRHALHAYGAIVDQCRRHKVRTVPASAFAHDLGRVLPAGSLR